MKKDWILSHWIQKIVYVAGWVVLGGLFLYALLMLLAFVAGFIVGFFGL